MARVEIYTTPVCPYCVTAKRLLKSKGVEAVEFDLHAHPGLKAEMVERAGGRTTVPQIFIDEKHIGGCDDLVALDKQGGLDPLLAA